MTISGIIKFKFKGLEVSLRGLSPQDVTREYVDGLNKEHLFLETKPDAVTISSQIEYIRDIEKDAMRVICGLWCGEKLIATAGGQRLDIETGKAPVIGIFIFNENFRGQGWGKILVWAMCHFLIKNLKVISIQASMKKVNLSSKGLFLRVGFEVVSEDAYYYHLELKSKNLAKPDEVTF